MPTHFQHHQELVKKMVNEFSAAHELWAAQIEHIDEMFALLSLIWGGSVRITSVQHPQRQHMAHP